MIFSKEYGGTDAAGRRHDRPALPSFRLMAAQRDVRVDAMPDGFRRSSSCAPSRQLIDFQTRAVELQSGRVQQ
jgi:hypothetical protein